MPRSRTRRLACERLEDRRNPVSLPAPQPAFSLDPTFGTNGQAVVDFADESAGEVLDTEVGSDGKVWVLGTRVVEPVLVRLNPNGSPDSSFDGDGVLPLLDIFPPSFYFDRASVVRYTQLALTPQGQAVLTGTFRTDTVTQVAMAVRLNADGSRDTSFGGASWVGIAASETSGGTVTPLGLVVLADGRVVVANQVRELLGDNSPPGPPPPRAVTSVVTRLTADGDRDTTFDGDGDLTIDPVFTDAAGATFATDAFGTVAVASDGGVTVFGTRTDDGAATQLVVTARRFDAAGRPDTTFSADGYAEAMLVSIPKPTDRPGYTAYLTGTILGAILQADRGVVFGLQDSEYQGLSGVPDSGIDVRNTLLGRFTADGTFDTTFGTAGLVKRHLGNVYFGPPEVFKTLQAVEGFADGSIAVVESVNVPQSVSPAGVEERYSTITRYDDHGQPILDQTGDADFRFPTPVGGQDMQASDVRMDATGRVVTAGVTVADADGRTRIAAERYVLTDPFPNDARRTLLLSRGNGEVKRVTVGNATASVGPAYRPLAGYTGRVGATPVDLDGNGVLDAVYSRADSSAGGAAVVVTFGTNTDAVRPSLTLTPFEAGFTGGVSVAVADLDADGRPDLIVSAGSGGGGRVQVYSLVAGGLVKRADFFGIADDNFRGGATATAADANGDGRPDLIVAAGQGGGPRVAVFDGRTLLSGAVGLAPPKLLNDFFAYGGDDAGRLRNGVTVAATDVNADGRVDLIFGAGVGGARRVYGVDGPQLMAGRFVPLVSFFVGGDAASRNGVPVSAQDVNADGKLDLIAEQPLGVRVYDGNTLATLAGEPPVLRDVYAFDPIPVD